MTWPIDEKLKLVNKLSLQIMAEGDIMSIIKIVTEEAVRIFEADFGFAWGEFQVKDTFKVVYQTRTLPFDPVFPFETRGQNIRHTLPFYDSEVKQKNYKTKMSSFLKSYIIIPIHYFDHSYGNIIIGYKKKQNFTQEDAHVFQALGNAIAQTITINWVVENEHRALELVEKQTETEVLLAQEKLKNEFIANTTHEFRTPLTIMRGFIYLATKNSKEKGASALKATQDALRAIDKEIVNLSDLFSDLVLITSDRQKKVELVRVNIVEIAYRAADKLKNFAEEKGITIIKKKSPKNVLVLGDEKYLERTFLNLIRNAITYGGSKIEVSIEAKKNTVSINIADDGVGISSDDLPHVFERFFRADRSHNREGGHSGLGLAIVKWVAETHEGKINVKSTLDVGSTFTFTLPLAKKN